MAGLTSVEDEHDTVPHYRDLTSGSRHTKVLKNVVPHNLGKIPGAELLLPITSTD